MVDIGEALGLTHANRDCSGVLAIYVCDEGSEAVLQATNGVTHHNPDTSSNLVRIQHEIETFMDEAVE